MKDKKDIIKSEIEGEFLPGVTDEFNPKEMSGISRRKFLALVGASAAFAATSCTNYQDKGEILPYIKKPEEVTLGKANYYASTCTECPLACGTLVKTREGRPVKIQGNPEHPINKGKICAIGESTVLNLYSPDRIKFPLNKKGSDLFLFKNDVVKDSWLETDKEIIQALREENGMGKEIAIITHTVNSPSLINLFKDFTAKFSTTKVYSYELFDEQNRHSAWKQCYGDSPMPAIDWSKAKTILSLEADILGNEGSFLEQMRSITSMRNPDEPDKYCRLYTAEAGMSLTGINSDYRFRIRPELQYDLVMTLLNEILIKRQLSAIQATGAIQTEIQKYSLDSFASANNLNQNDLHRLVTDLLNTKGNSIVYAGSKLDEPTHIAVNYLNEVLGSANLYSGSMNKSLMPLTTSDELKGLINKMNSGNVGIVIHFATNPVFHFPVDWGYAQAMKKVGKIITLTEEKNETSVLSKLTLPINHYLESWGDFQVRTGVLSLQQPMIAPIHNTRQKEAILLNWLSDKPESFSQADYHKYIKNRWEKEVYPNSASSFDFQQFWYNTLQLGVLTYDEPVKPLNQFNFSGSMQKTEPRGYTLILNKSQFLWDGKFANNGWLQEIPHPVTKVTWDNYAAMSENTAKELNVSFDNRVKIEANGKNVELPVLVQPGMADKVIVVEMGYGRWEIGDVGKKVGVNVNNLTGNLSLNSRIITGAAVSKTAGNYVLAATQEHHAITEPKVKEYHLKRKIIVEGTLNDYKNNPNFVVDNTVREVESITSPREYKGIKWAMAIDLNRCTGCSQCVASCNVENNIAVVGREQVLKGREMQWIRIDRYYAGDNEKPDVSVQPMLCFQCDNAPCENVCPVAATNHSPDGLNQMTYNRCVGTRYCSNNCPVKVRRFNFFDYRSQFRDGFYEQEPVGLVHNPEVTVRGRGVMEKCTFCVQRIMDARQNAIKENRPLKGSDVKTACQMSCPAEAIVFGDMNDPESNVSKMREHKLNYYVLADLNIKPNVSYKAKLKNKNTEEA